VNLPSSNMLSYILENNAQVIIRPSGTEPKMKAYLTVFEKTAEESAKMLNNLEKLVVSMLEL